jgi:hypothetical protein
MRLGRFLIMTSALAAVSCGSGGLTTSSPPMSMTNGSAAGIWVGTDSASGLSLTGIINAAGLADFIRSDGAQYVGTAQVSGTDLTIALNVYTQFGSFFTDGTTFGTGTLSAMLASGSSISGSVNFTTTDNDTVSSNWSLGFSSIYNDASSLSVISANYADSSTGDPLDGATVSITSSGGMTAQSGTTGCILNGQIATADTSNDAYEVAYTLANCTGADAVLNGIELTGLAVLNSNGQLVVGVSGQSSGGTNYGVVSGLTPN